MRRGGGRDGRYYANLPLPTGTMSVHLVSDAPTTTNLRKPGETGADTGAQAIMARRAITVIGATRQRDVEERKNKNRRPRRFLYRTVAAPSPTSTTNSGSRTAPRLLYATITALCHHPALFERVINSLCVVLGGHCDSVSN